MEDLSYPLMSTSGLILIEWKVGHCKMFRVVSHSNLSLSIFLPLPSYLSLSPSLFHESSLLFFPLPSWDNQFNIALNWVILVFLQTIIKSPFPGLHLLFSISIGEAEENSRELRKRDQYSFT